MRIKIDPKKLPVPPREPTRAVDIGESKQSHIPQVRERKVKKYDIKKKGT